MAAAQWCPARWTATCPQSAFHIGWAIQDRGPLCSRRGASTEVLCIAGDPGSRSTGRHTNHMEHRESSGEKRVAGCGRMPVLRCAVCVFRDPANRAGTSRPRRGPRQEHCCALAAVAEELRPPERHLFGLHHGHSRTVSGEGNGGSVGRDPAIDHVDAACEEPGFGASQETHQVGDVGGFAVATHGE